MPENIGLAEDYNEREGRLHPTVWEVYVIVGDVIVSRDFLMYYNPLSSLTVTWPKLWQLGVRLP